MAKKKAPFLSLFAGSMAWSCTIRVYARAGEPACVTYQELSVGCRGGERTIGTVNVSELTSDLGRLLFEADDSIKLVGLTSIGSEPLLSEPEAEFLAMCWCSEHEYVAVPHLLVTLNADQRRQVFELFKNGFRNAKLRNFCRQALSLQPEVYAEIVGSIGAVIDRAWFDLAAADVASRTAAEASRLKEERRRAARAQEKLYGRPDEVRDPAELVRRFGTKIPLGYLAHATEYPRPDLTTETVETLLLSWGTRTRLLPGGQWRCINISDGDLAFLSWVLDGREEETLAQLALRQDEETQKFFRKLNRRVAVGTKSSPQGGGPTGAITWAIYWYYLKLKAAVPEAYQSY